MKPSRRVSTFLFAACLVSVLMMPEGHTTTAVRSAVRHQTLDTGLQVVWEEDHRQPLVAIEARIKGGLRGEGRYVGTGITHFIEHMLFKGTPSRPPGTIEQEVRSYGGTINAFTSLDVTGVTLFVEARYLKEALGLLADILQHAVFDQAEFDKERAVIVSEIQMNLDDPDRRLHRLFFHRHFREHPYRHPILGYRALLEGLTVEDLSTFYAAQYQPQNVTLACVGDLDGEVFFELVHEVFGAWPRGRVDPQQQLVPQDPPPVSVRDVTVELPVHTVYAVLGFPSVRLAHPDLYPLDVLAGIVGQGRSSRLYETIVRQRQLAHSITAWNYTPADPGIFAVQFRTDPDKLGTATDAVLEILEAIQQDGVTADELRKAKKMVNAAYLFGLQTVDAKASDLATSMNATGDPLFSRRYVAGIDAVTREQVQEVAQRYIDRTTMTTATIRPRTASATAEDPAPAAPVQISVVRATLENGTTTLIGVDRTLPIAGIVVVFRGGVRAEGKETQGLSNLVSQLLIKGTKRKDALRIAEQIESLGGTLQPFSGRDGFGLVLQLLAEDLPEGLALVHELVTQSAFSEEELRIQRDLIASQIKMRDDEIFSVGGRLLRRTLFQEHPYRFHPLGEQETVDTFTRAQCVEFAAQWLVPSNTVISVFGDVDRAVVERQLQQTFGAIPSGETPWPDRLSEPPIREVREALHTMEKEQALIMLGFFGNTYTAPDRHALDVMTTVLSGMAGRLFQSVREEHGLSYTLGAVHIPGWDPGLLLVYAATRPEELEKVRGIIDEQLELVITEGFTDKEIRQAKQYLIGAHRLDTQDIVGLAKRTALDESHDVGYDAWTTYEDEINAITPSMVHEAAKQYLTMQHRAEVIVSPNGNK